MIDVRPLSGTWLGAYGAYGPICSSVTGGLAFGWCSFPWERIDFPNNAVSAIVGSVLELRGNAMRNCTIGLQHNLAAGAFAFGEGNKYDSNGTNENAVGASNYRNVLACAQIPATGVRTRIFYDTTAPVAGAWNVGDLIYNIAPAAAGPGTIGWVCVTAGSPGTWRAFGALV